MFALKHHTIKPLAAAVRYARWPLASWASLALLPGAAFAGPQGEQVAAGIVNVTRPNAQSTRVQQGSDKAIVNWHSFSVGGQEYVHFVQPGSTSAILNRVVGGQESQILGQMSANGRVFLVNPQGVYFGPGAKVDAAGLTASTLDIGDQDFMAGRYVFAKQAGAGDAEVRNAGEIRADQYAVLIGDRVANEGVVEARLGTVALAAGGKVSLQLDNTGLVNFAVDEKTLAAQAGVENAGQLLADGGRVLMTAKVASDLVATAVNNAGVVRATGIDEDDGGAIVLRGVGGDVVNSGIVDASGANGGRVALVSDEDVIVTDGAKVLATGSGAGKGGVVRLIGEQNLVVEEGAQVRAAGGADGGQGGFVEISAHRGGMAVGETAVDPGRGGALLIDPTFLSLQNNASAPGGTTSVTVGKGFVEGQLNAGIDVLLIATDEINASGVSSVVGTDADGDLTIAIGTVTGAPSSAGVFSLNGTGLPAVTTNNHGDINLAGVGFDLAGKFRAIAGVGTNGSGAGNIQLGDVRAGKIELAAGLGPSGRVTAGKLVATDATVTLTTPDIVVQGASVNLGGELKAANQIQVLAEDDAMIVGDVIINGLGNGLFNVSRSDGTKLGGQVTITGDVQVTASQDAFITVKGNRASLQGLSASANHAEVKVFTESDISINGAVAAEGVTAGALVNLSQTSTGTGTLSVLGKVEAHADAGLASILLTGATGITLSGDLLAGNSVGDASINVSNRVGTVGVAGTVSLSALRDDGKAHFQISNPAGLVKLGEDLRVRAGLVHGAGSGVGSFANALVEANQIHVGGDVLAEVLSAEHGGQTLIMFLAHGQQLSPGTQAIEVLGSGGVSALNGVLAGILLDTDGTSTFGAGIRVNGDVTASGHDISDLGIRTRRGSIAVDGRLNSTGRNLALLEITAANAGDIAVADGLGVVASHGNASAIVTSGPAAIAARGAVQIGGPVSVLGETAGASLSIIGRTLALNGDISVTGRGNQDTSLLLSGEEGVAVNGDISARQLGAFDASINIQNMNGGTINVAGKLEALGGSDAQVNVAGQGGTIAGGLVAVAGGRGVVSPSTAINFPDQFASVHVQGANGWQLGAVRAVAPRGAATVDIAGGTGAGNAPATLSLTDGISAYSNVFSTVQVVNSRGRLEVSGPVVAKTDVPAGMNPLAAKATVTLQGRTVNVADAVSAITDYGPAMVSMLAGQGQLGSVSQGGALNIEAKLRAYSERGEATVQLFGGGIDIAASVMADSKLRDSRLFVSFDSGVLNTGEAGLLSADRLLIAPLGSSSGLAAHTAAREIFLANTDFSSLAQLPSTSLQSALTMLPAPSTRKTLSGHVELDNSAYRGDATVYTYAKLSADGAGNPVVDGLVFNHASFLANDDLRFRSLTVNGELIAQRLAVTVANGAARFETPVFVGNGTLPGSLGDKLSLLRLAEAAATAGITLPLPAFNGSPTSSPNAFFAARLGLEFAGGLTFKDPDVPYVVFLTDTHVDLGPGVASIDPDRQDFLAQFAAYSPGQTVHIENTMPDAPEGNGPYFLNDLNFSKLPGTTLLFGGALGPRGNRATAGDASLVVGANGALDLGHQNAFFLSEGPITGLGNVVSTGLVAPASPLLDASTLASTSIETVVGSVQAIAESTTVDQLAEPAVDDSAAAGDEQKDDKKDGESVEIADADGGQRGGVVAHKSNTGQMCQ